MADFTLNTYIELLQTLTEQDYSFQTFRARPGIWDEEIIQEIASPGHEIGYHYEELSTCKGDHAKSIETFKQNLEKLRELGLIGEPYFDVDFFSVLYLTDTIMFTIHPQRWHSNKLLWLNELIAQSLKNVAKRMLNQRKQ